MVGTKLISGDLQAIFRQGDWQIDDAFDGCFVSLIYMCYIFINTSAIQYELPYLRRYRFDKNRHLLSAKPINERYGDVFMIGTSPHIITSGVGLFPRQMSSLTIASHRHTGPVLFGGWGFLPKYFSSACPKVKWFAQILLLFCPKMAIWQFCVCVGGGGGCSPLPPSPSASYANVASHPAPLRIMPMCLLFRTWA